MQKFILVFFSLHLPIFCRALSWSRQPARIDSQVVPLLPKDVPNTVLYQDPHPGDLDLSDSTLTKEEISAFLASYDSLDSYARRPDCFRRAAGIIRVRCGKVDMDEGERVNAAISMTLCELATAKHHSPPLECAPFTLDNIFQRTSLDTILQGECVDALSRSAQFWSSYSGYLREVPQLCFAFRRWNDIDIAKDIYKNATLEKVALIRFLLQREKIVANNLHSTESRLSKMQDLLTSMQLTHEFIENASREAVVRLGDNFSDALLVLKGALLGFQSNYEDDKARSLYQFEAALEEITQDHAMKLGTLLTSFEVSFMGHLNTVWTQFYHQAEISLAVTNQVHERWTSLGAEVYTLQESITQLSGAVSQVMLTLDDSMDQVQQLSQAQAEVFSSTSNLIATIAHLTVTTHEELDKINTTASSIKHALSLPQHGANQWWITRFITILEFCLRVDFSSYELNNIPICRVAFILLGFAFYLFRTAFTAAMSILLLFFSSRKYSSTLITNLTSTSSQTSCNKMQRFPPFLSHPNQHYHLPELRMYYRFRQSRPSARVSRIPDRLCKSGVP